MHRLKLHPYRRPLSVLSGVLALSLGQAAIASPCVAPLRDVQTGRYQSITATATPDQADLLSQVIAHEFRDDIQTVGAAVKDLLQGSGFRLLSPKFAETFRVHLFALPLPEVQRRLGPLSLRDALELISGEGFRLVVDPVYRLVSFELIQSAGEGDAPRL